MLTASETVDDFKEVSEAEKLALEASDVAWVRPPQLFIDQWNLASGSYGKFNEETGFFELNGLVDITYNQAIRIYKESAYVNYLSYNGSAEERTIPNFTNSPCRTFFPLYSWYSFPGFVLFRNCTKLEVVKILPWYGDGLHMGSERDMFNGCSKLRIIDAVLVDRGNKDLPWYGTFAACYELQEVRIRNLKTNISFSYCKVLSYDSLAYMINNAANNSAITITVHADVWVKIMDEGNEEWHSLVELASAKNITIATP